MTNDNPVYEPGIYLTLEEVERHAAKHKGNPIMQQLAYLMRREEWQPVELAPKDETEFWVYRASDGYTTRAYFYWYTESAHIDGQDVACWALQDAIKDWPLDDEGFGGYFWRPLPVPPQHPTRDPRGSDE